MENDTPIPKSRWPRRLRVAALGLIALLILAMPVGWLISMLPADRPDPVAKDTQNPARAANVVPPEAKLPWTRQLDEPAAVVVNEARFPWTRSVTQPGPAMLAEAQSPWKRNPAEAPATVNVPGAGLPWTRSTARPRRVDVTEATLPWPAGTK